MIPAAPDLSTIRHRLLLSLLLLWLIPSGVSGAAWEVLPRGTWLESEDSELQLAIQAKNVLTFSGKNFTNQITVKARVTAQVREEYWCIIQAVESKDVPPGKTPPPRKQKQPGEKTAKDTVSKQPARAPEPLGMSFLKKGERLVLTIGYDQKKKKPVLEVLIFGDGEIAREYLFVRP